MPVNELLTALRSARRRLQVSDDFSIALARHLYDNLFGKRNFLPRALQLALHEVLEH